MSVVASSVADRIATITLDAPPVNALKPQGWIDLCDTMSNMSDTTDICAVVLRGVDGRFCAGADISVLAEAHDEPAFMLRIVGDTAAAIRECRVPVIAAVDGPAHGGGLELILACDVVVASPRATFAASGVNMGLIASVPALTQLVGSRVASHMALTGERVDASSAVECGLITLIDDSPADRAADIARVITAKAPLAVEANKRALRAHGSVTPSEHERLVTELFTELEQTADHHEAVDAFLNKRSPNFERS